MNENNFIEVNGVSFETIVPKRVLTLPKKDILQKFSYIGKHISKPPLHPSPGYPVEIGIRITNNSDRPLYFSFYFALFPEIIRAKDGASVPFDIGWYSLASPLKSDFILAIPGESISFFLDAKISWLCGKNYGFTTSFGGERLLIQPLHSERPLFGWGFNGFGIPYPDLLLKKNIPNVVRLGNVSYDIVAKNGKLRTLPLPTYKAHNLILDNLLSVGVLGMLSYLVLWGYYIFLVVRSSNQKMLVVAIAYLIFTFTWFKCAQFTNIAWWSMSVQFIAGNREQETGNSGTNIAYIESH